MGNGVTGANRDGYHLRNVNVARDLEVTRFGDFRRVRAGEPDPVGGRPLKERRGIEVGHIFKLGTKYSERIDAGFTDDKKQRHLFVMGCYGIGISRTLQAVIEQSHQQVQQASHNVTTLKPLEGQLPGKQAAIDTAKYNLDNCRVVAPFNALVTNLTISQGAYATAGQHIFTLIDNRTWWVIANFRETQLHNIRPGMLADVYVMSRPNVRYKGVVESVGFGVTPDSDLVGHLSSPGLPDVQRTLNWVHLASRFPVRIRIQASPPDVFRLGESAVVIVREHAPRAAKD